MNVVSKIKSLRKQWTRHIAPIEDEYCTKPVISWGSFKIICFIKIPIDMFSYDLCPDKEDTLLDIFFFGWLEKTSNIFENCSEKFENHQN